MQEPHFSIHTTKVAIIGAGFGGLAMAIRLIQVGIRDFLILEKQSQVGGTWRDNQYPGAACDVQSHLYSLSFAPKTNWSKRYAEAHEIFSYVQSLVKDFQLEDYCRLNCEVLSAQYNEQNCTWKLQLSDQSTMISQFVIFASGPLHYPEIPKIQGIEKFKGEIFHSAQWNHDYTLKGKKVASIGTGGSAIQYIPKIAPDVTQLYVFQRNAAWVLPRDDRHYFKIEKKLFAKYDWLRQLHRIRLYWSNESRVLPILQPSIVKYAEKLATQFIHFQVNNSETAKQLTPNYKMGCKRILISNTYFPTFNRNNVELITTQIQEIKEHSIITSDGQEREIDCLIYGTGFITDPCIYLKSFQCLGLNAVELKDVWSNGAESYYGISIKNFPNLFQLLGPNTLLSHNSVIFMIEAQVNYILQAIQSLQNSGHDALVIKNHIHDQFNQHLQQQFSNTVWQSGCVSWYQHHGGKNFALWPTYTWKYWKNTHHFNPQEYHLLRKSA